MYIVNQSKFKFLKKLLKNIQLEEQISYWREDLSVKLFRLWPAGGVAIQRYRRTVLADKEDGNVQTTQ